MGPGNGGGDAVKATSHSEKKRRRRQRKAEEHALTKDPFALAEVPRREPNGKPSRAAKAGPDRPALIKRASIMNKPITDETLRDMRAPWHGCSAGVAIAKWSDHDHEREKLWQAVCHMRKTVAAYDRAIGAPSRHAQCMRLLLPLEAMQADAASPPLDDRTPEEKQRQAVSAWMQMHGWLTYTDGRAASEALRVVIDDGEVKDTRGLMSALFCVYEGLQGGRIILRDRGLTRG